MAKDDSVVVLIIDGDNERRHTEVRWMGFM
jgi:hypothetical protein